MPTTLVGRVGDDDFGCRALTELERHGIPGSGVQVDAGSDTGLAVIPVDADT